jgi:hypothetical protein
VEAASKQGSRCPDRLVVFTHSAQQHHHRQRGFPHLLVPSQQHPHPLEHNGTPLPLPILTSSLTPLPGPSLPPHPKPPPPPKTPVLNAHMPMRILRRHRRHRARLHLRNPPAGVDDKHDVLPLPQLQPLCHQLRRPEESVWGREEEGRQL